MNKKGAYILHMPIKILWPEKVLKITYLVYLYSSKILTIPHLPIFPQPLMSHFLWNNINVFLHFLNTVLL